MTRLSRRLFPLSPLAFLAALSLAPVAVAGDADDVEKVLGETAAELATARSAGNSWTSTDKLVTAAREALASGDTTNALELANRALLTANMAQQQGNAEQGAWQARVPTAGK